ncbi:hypothetical protein [Lachnoanaerobaculum sp. OBRC5-5]|jgi:hypothetical protein|uniref:hypothetical protein n=1 Tax=Lachnoanaerobaculum sp. OBRC5-5 TaxID=936595 RepID=UPI000282521B|nr:hypothetical protein [Lachnoanaerobaculum sp. OBRC5-5]EJZ69845.1 hypothetical protein HMPREF1135_01494 [Lachnoanaerobaculum sp. OBRC5-5]RKW53372.1 MAG: hypothetical protein D8H95_12745 [Lachnospiraceae bacterium]
MNSIYLVLWFALVVLNLILFKGEKNKLLYSAVFGVIITVVVICINIFCLFPSDYITIRALNEKEVSAENTYITVQNIKDKNDNILGYKVSDGKWLDTNGGQRWGGVSVTGITDSITIKFQKGNSRKINFHATRWGGKVAISFNGSSEKIVSTYKDSDNDVVSVMLPNTGNITKLDFINILLLFIEYFLLEVIAFLLYKIKDKIILFIKRYQYECIAVVIAFVGFVIMMSLGNYKSTWMDDSATMGIAAKNRSLGNVIETILKEESTTPPLYTIAWHYFSKLIPVGVEALTLWARMLSIIANTLGFYVGAIVVRKGWNKYVGIIFEMLLITSNALIVNSGFAVRSYGFMILMSLFLLYVIIRRFEDGIDSKNKITALYTVAILAICYTHYFGILTCLGFFLYECYLFIKKRYTYKFIFSYIVAGAVYLPWLIVNYIITREQWGSVFWISPPNYSSIIAIVVWLLSSQELVMLCLTLGFFITLYKVKENRVDISLNIALIITIAVEIAIVFIYSKYINPKSSVWTHRYFLNLLPYMLIIASFGLVNVVSFFTEDKIKKAGFVYTVLAFLIFVNSNVVFRVKGDMEGMFYQPYREAAEYLLNQPDANSPDTLVLISSVYSTGWDYYLSHNGKFEPLSYKKNFDGLDIQKYTKVYLLDIHVKLDDNNRKILEDNFHQISQDEKSTVQTYVRN